MQELKLIALYYYVCECYDEELRWHCQRFSNNRSQDITDEELLTVYLYSLMYENKKRLTEVHNYAKRYLMSWFPAFPAYATMVDRLNRMSAVFPLLVKKLLQTVDRSGQSPFFLVLDSFPIMLCSSKRRGKVAREFVDKGFCATKGLHYYGVKLHAINFRRAGKLPIPEFLHLSAASENDLSAMRLEAERLVECQLFADKAYADARLQAEMAKKGAALFTPVKLVKGESVWLRQFKKAADDLFSTAVSAIRQPIESFFNWLNEHFDIQNGAKIRSNNGLIVHVFGRVAAAIAFWVFNP